jgi:hypothetical protein
MMVVLLLVMMMVRSGAEAADARVSAGHGARHADEVSCRRGRAVVGQGLKGHGVIERQAVGGHRRAPAGVEQGTRVATERRGVGAVGGWLLSCAVRWCENATTSLLERI